MAESGILPDRVHEQSKRRRELIARLLELVDRLGRHEKEREAVRKELDAIIAELAILNSQ
ncbi:MAG: hypothetical protein HYS13_10255 [Planctomycetia bacterium]|nr:hypothetical protein [Planctomycetia bacterium]